MPICSGAGTGWISLIKCYKSEIGFGTGLSRGVIQDCSGVYTGLSKDGGMRRGYDLG